MSSLPTQTDIILAQILTKFASTIQSAVFLTVASVAAMVYDTIVTIDQEVKFVWHQRWSFGKAIFLFTRHFSTLLMIGHVISMLWYNPSPSACFIIENVFVWSQALITIVGSSALVVRTWLLCGGELWVFHFLVLGLIGVTIPSLTFVAIDGISVIPNPAPALLPGCLVQISPNSWRPFVFPLVYETLVLCVTLFKTCTTRSRTPIMMRLFRDGTLYYVGIIAVLIVTTAGATNDIMRPIVIGSGFQIASVSIGCSRLILSLHVWSEEQKEKQSDKSTSNKNISKDRLSNNVPTSQSSSYELRSRKLHDLESREADVHSDGDSINPVPPPVPPKDIEFRSILPDIEQPSLSERMWSTLPGAHTRQQEHRYVRPPRSSSLYGSGQFLERLSRSPSMAPVMEVEGSNWGAHSAQTLGRVDSARRGAM